MDRRWFTPTSKLRPLNRPPKALRNESVAPIYSAAGGDAAGAARRSPGGNRPVYAIAGFRSAWRSVPHHSGADVLSRGKPVGNGPHRDRAAGTAVRRNAGTEPDDLPQLGRGLGDRAAVQ